VLKPASATPFSALALAELGERAGLPPGVFNVVTGSAGAIGGELTSNPVVRKLIFTGSAEIGKQLLVQCADTVKKVSLELGGNAPFFVFDDANLDAAVAGAIASKFRNTGQTCVCTNRFLVQDEVYEDFASRLTKAVAALRVGDGLQEGVEQGPLIDQAAVLKVEEQITDALGKGTRLLLGGQRHALGGTYFQLTVLAEVTPDMAVSLEDTFGPAAYFYSRDLARTWRVSEALKYGIEEFLEAKYLCIGNG